MGQDQRRESDSIQPDELQSLLLRLHAPEMPIEPPDDYATVAAVCEATGESAYRVREILEQIRQEDLESRIEARLREAEEPLYRVERPGTYADPLDSTTNMLARRRAIKTILDKIPKVDVKRSADAKQKEFHADQGSRFAGNLVLVTTLLLFLVVIVVAVVVVLRLG
jgi:hypothetical protein